MKINRHGLQLGYRDVWDYTYLGDVMVRWLKTFKKHGKMGCPSQYLPPSDTGDYSDEQIEEGLQKLYKDIDDLIWALEDEHEPPIWGNESWEDYKVKLEKYDKERQEKLQLFAKLYTMLWI